MEVLLIMAVLLIIGVVVYGMVASAQRRKDLMAWASAKSLSFAPDRDGCFEDRYPDFRCFAQGDGQRYAYNIMSGPWGQRQIQAFDYHYMTESRDSKGNRTTSDHHFSCVMIASEIALEPLVIRPEGLFDKVKAFFGAEDINFESAEFSRKFYVSAPDKKWAYDVIHARTMEFLLAQPMFHIEFAGPWAIAYRDNTFTPADFEQAAQTICGILDRLPEYVRRQQVGSPA